ncbi:MAG: alpha/beta hydrolase, partial [Chloroflexi bacterium]|nr:alpha/beta hydrolase [Chloroflexota bacterium]
ASKRDEMANILRQHGAKSMASGFVNIAGCKLYYDEHGEGHPLVLLHAGIADHRMWDEQMPVFAERYRVIRWDMRGFGQSKTEAGTYSLRDDLLALLKHLGVEHAYVCGVSMGGALTIDFALEHPEMVDAIIPVAPGVSGYQPPSEDSPKAQWEKETFARGEQAWKEKDIAQYIELQLQVWVDGPLQPPDRVPAPMREKVRVMMQDEDPTEWAPKSLDPPAVDRLSEIRVPTRVIYGDLDPTETMRTCTMLGEQIPNAQTRLMRGTAHLPNMERPDEFNRIVLDFLNSITAA